MSNGTAQGDVIVPGEKVYLGQMRRDLLQTYRRWVNDLQIANTLGLIQDVGYPMTDEAEAEWFDAVTRDSSNAMFTVYETGSGAPVGNVSLSGLRHPHRSAEFGLVIGERNSHGRGYGTEATRLMLDFGFTMLGLHRVWLQCVAFNQAAIRAYERAGFTEYGRAREVWVRGDQRHDVVLMDILAREFQSPVLAGMLGNERPS